MPSDHVERRAAAGAYPPPQQAESLPCPRCDSTNTKFCYYNNYNLQQPRHFCKSCRRYWTHGGALRNIPVGGTSRKTPKRSRPSPAPTANGVVSGHESFTLPPGSQGPTGFLALGGYGVGPIAGFDPMGLYGNWGFPEVGNAAEGDTWQLNGVESAVVGDGDCFPWPELAISMPSQLQ